MIHGNDDGSPNQITFIFTDLAGNRIEELPVTGTKWGYALNGAGSFGASLNIHDARVQAMAWRAATAPNLSCAWIDINGTLVYGGIINQRKYQRSTGLITIGALDHASYLARRLQAKDYSTNWANTPTGAAQISYAVLLDALAVSGSLSISIDGPAATPSQYGVTLSAPISQRMTIDSVFNQLATLGWRVGFDYAVDVAYVAGVPTTTLTIDYPRRGRIAGSTGLVMDLTNAIEFDYDEDGTAQAWQVVETSSGTGAVATLATWEPASSVDGYPLLERVGSHTATSAGAEPKAILAANAANDLALSAYPVTTATVTMPMFAEPALGEWIVGDDVRVTVPMVSGGLPPADPRFPDGLDFYWRIFRADCDVPDQGVPTVTYSLTLPPSSTPQRPPQ